MNGCIIGIPGNAKGKPPIGFMPALAKAGPGPGATGAIGAGVGGGLHLRAFSALKRELPIGMVASVAFPCTYSKVSIELDIKL
jgi:hypothetical protein